MRTLISSPPSCGGITTLVFLTDTDTHVTLGTWTRCNQSTRCSHTEVGNLNVQQSLCIFFSISREKESKRGGPWDVRRTSSGDWMFLVPAEFIEQSSGFPHGGLDIFCSLLIDEARAKDKTYTWVSVRWKTKKLKLRNLSASHTLGYSWNWNT
jgi:hypothetical protein